ncbi:MAG TPA: hypothetical protein VK469_01705, partial [Candidatus Kapabacteria bacterium]|nr:hypothetical protein [Candidatus Kapabacteria bacterium]
ILEKGNWQEALKLFGGLEFDANNTTEKLLQVTPFVIIPSGGLMSMQNDSTFKYILEQYVNRGGTIIVFAQQYGAHVESVVPIAEGESLKTYGWREDQSCLRFSAYFEKNHPVLSSSTNELVNAGVDGYFSAYPSNSTILLKRKVNLEPALLYYPYGNGTVILTSIFTDWASAHSQATTSEIKIIRDLIAFAKNPHLPIPMFDLAQNPTPAINLNISIINKTEEPSTKVKLMAYTPDRKTVLYENEVGLSLNAGESTTIPVQFTLSELQPKDYGICHVDYELYDAENHLIQLRTESDSGRFSIYKIITPITIKEGVYQWLTVKDENVYWGQDAEITMHFKNTTNEPKTFSINNPFFDFGHGHKGDEFSSFTVNLPANSTYEHTIYLGTTQFSPDIKSSLTVRIQYYDANNVLKQIGAPKVIFLKGVVTQSSLKLTTATSSPIPPGGTINYEINSTCIDEPLPGITNIKLILEKFIRQSSEFSEIQLIYQVDHDFTKNNIFKYSGSYIPASIHPGGLYRLKLEVTSPNSLKEPIRCCYFFYDQSVLITTLGKIQEEGGVLADKIIPGHTYTIPIKVKNISRNNYDIKNGNCTILLISDTGSEAYHKNITDITIKNGEEIQLLETFVFTPTKLGTYSFQYRSWDETRERPTNFTTVQCLNCSTDISIIPDKNIYNYLDTANINVIVAGAGNYTIHFTCVQAGLDETRNVQIPQGSSGITELFQIPISHMSLSPFYTINVEVKDSIPLTVYKSINLAVSPLVFDYHGNFTESFARAGSDIHLNLAIKPLSGINVPLNGQLSVTSSKLNYQNIKSITLQPVGDNTFNYTIPISSEVASGVYTFEVQFKFDDTVYINQNHSILLPPAKLDLSIPAASYNAGETIDLTITNSGGKNGQFDIQALLKDSLNKIVLQKQETRILTPGASDSFQLTLPQECKSGSYQLVLKSTETLTNTNNEKRFAVSINGLTASLNAYTLKENYFANETISGKAEITTPHTIENALLKARIVQMVSSTSGIEEQKHGDFITYNSIRKAYQQGNKFYLATGTPGLGLLEYDKNSQNITPLYNLDNITINRILLRNNNELWLGTSGNLIIR